MKEKTQLRPPPSHPLLLSRASPCQLTSKKTRPIIVLAGGCLQKFLSFTRTARHPSIVFVKFANGGRLRLPNPPPLPLWFEPCNLTSKETDSPRWQASPAVSLAPCIRASSRHRVGRRSLISVRFNSSRRQHVIQSLQGVHPPSPHPPFF